MGILGYGQARREFPKYEVNGFSVKALLHEARRISI